MQQLINDAFYFCVKTIIQSLKRNNIIEAFYQLTITSLPIFMNSKKPINFTVKL